MFIDLDWQTLILGTEEESCEVKPLSMKAYQKVMAYTQSNAEATSKPKTPGTVFDTMGDEKMASLLKDVIPTHVRNIRGITFKHDSEIRDLTPEDLITYDAFVIINMQIIGKIFAISSLAGLDQSGEEKEADSVPQKQEPTVSSEQ